MNLIKRKKIINLSNGKYAEVCNRIVLKAPSLIRDPMGFLLRTGLLSHIYSPSDVIQQ